MKRKRLFTTLVVLSVLTLLAWAWSYVGVFYERHYQFFAIREGSFVCQDYRWAESQLYFDPVVIEQLAQWHWTIGESAGLSTNLPYYEWGHEGLPSHPTIVLPLWIPFVLFATYPAITMIRSHRRRKHQRADGCCPKCGYDLRGNVSGICPECGTKMVSEALVDRSRPPAPPSKRNDHRA